MLKNNNNLPGLTVVIHDKTKRVLEDGFMMYSLIIHFVISEQKSCMYLNMLVNCLAKCLFQSPPENTPIALQIIKYRNDTVNCCLNNLCEQYFRFV